MDFDFGVDLLIEVLGGHGGAVGSGQAAGDGHNENLVGSGESVHPAVGTGAGSAGATLECGEIVHHIPGVQPGVVQKIPLPGVDDHGDGLESGAAEAQQVRRRIGNDLSHKNASYGIGF